MPEDIHNIDPDRIRMLPGVRLSIDYAETGTKLISKMTEGYLWPAPIEVKARYRLRIAKDVEPGQVYIGKVGDYDFGAFVEFLPGKEGLVQYRSLTKRGWEGRDVVNSVMK